MPPTPPRSPEGMAIALPVVYATKDKWQAMRYCVYSGLAEPLAVAVLNVFIASQVSEQTLNVFMAAGALGVRCLNRESAWKGCTSVFILRFVLQPPTAVPLPGSTPGFNNNYNICIHKK